MTDTVNGKPVSSNGNEKLVAVPKDYEELQKWFNIIRHCNSIIVRGANQFVTVTAYVDRNGKPQLHTAPERKDAFPRWRDADFVDEHA
jgi:hypothetical protein